MAATSINCLAVVLKELGWSYTRLIAELRRHASVALPKTESMVTLVSRWVNNHQQPDDFYRDLLSRATGRTRAELFGDEPTALTALPSGLVVAHSVDALPASGEVPLSLAGDGLIAWLRQQEPELKDGSVERRSFLASLALLGVDLTALAPASSAQAGSAGERAMTVDGALLRDLDLTTAAYERMRHRVPGRHLMRQVVGHVELTEDVLGGSLWPAQKQRLLANLSQTTSLLWVFEQLEVALFEGIWERVLWAGAGRLYDRWHLESGVKRNREHPETFEIPDEEAKQAIGPRVFVKLIFDTTDVWGRRNWAERMWVEVVAVKRRHIVGVLRNDPLGIPFSTLAIS